jgi:hydrogenase maturation protease
MRAMRVLIAGFGNVLRGDDGFGVAVAERLLAGGVPDGVSVLDVGIGGIHLIQELLTPADGLVVIDAVDLARPPGTVLVIRPEIADVATLTVEDRRDTLADMHYATPERALLLARALDVLPDPTLLVGCQPADAERVGQGLCPAVSAAVDVAAAEVRRIVTGFGIPWQAVTGAGR